MKALFIILIIISALLTYTIMKEEGIENHTLVVKDAKKYINKAKELIYGKYAINIGYKGYSIGNLPFSINGDVFYHNDIIYISYRGQNHIEVVITDGKNKIHNVLNNDRFSLGKKKNTLAFLMPFGIKDGNYIVFAFDKTKKTMDYIPFKIKSRNVANVVSNGFAVLTMEYNQYIRGKTFINPDGSKGDYRAILKWAKYIGANSIWMIAYQTSGWHNINKSRRWVSFLDNINLLGRHAHRYNISIGAYIMSYFTPNYGNIKAGYEPSMMYKNGKLIPSKHISLASKKRFNDIVKKMKELESNPYVRFIGLDFIRTGEYDGCELSNNMVRDIKINTKNPPTWLGNIINKRLQPYIRLWWWWRAYRVSHLISNLKQKAGISKPLWAFTLGWRCGNEHGQDPAMFRDGGIDIDAVMLYEANYRQYKNMMKQWSKYNKSGINIIAGNVIDHRLLDSPVNNPVEEFYRRFRVSFKSLYNDRKIKGLFVHDVARLFHGRKGGFYEIEWMVAAGKAIATMREINGTLPLSIKISDYKIKGKNIYIYVSIKNNTDSIVPNVKVSLVKTPFVSKAKSYIVSIPTGGKINKVFKAKISNIRTGKNNMIAVRLYKDGLPPSFDFRFTIAQNTTHIGRLIAENN